MFREVERISDTSNKKNYERKLLLIKLFDQRIGSEAYNEALKELEEYDRLH